MFFFSIFFPLPLDNSSSEHFAIGPEITNFLLTAAENL